MADKKRQKKDGLPPGVKGPHQRPSQPPAKPASGNSRESLERASIPVLTRLLAVPRWLLVILIAASLLLGLTLTGPLAPLGAMFLLLVGTFLGWLLLLAWPALTPGRRMIRLVIVFAVVGLALLKLLGRF